MDLKCCDQLDMDERYEIYRQRNKDQPSFTAVPLTLTISMDFSSPPMAS